MQPQKKPAKAKKAADDDDDDKPLVQPKKKAKPALPVIVAKSRLRPSLGSIARRQQRVKERNKQEADDKAPISTIAPKGKRTGDDNKADGGEFIEFALPEQKARKTKQMSAARSKLEEDVLDIIQASKRASAFRKTKGGFPMGERLFDAKRSNIPAK